MRSLPAALAAVLLAGALAGCLGTGAPTLTTMPPAAVRDAAEFAQDGPWSRTLLPGAHAILPVEVLEVPGHDGTPVHMGLYLPDVPAGTRVPVIVDAGPYYGNGEGPVDDITDDRQSRFLVENFVPHGYAVALVSVRGTGNSGGCSDFMGPKEQADLDAAITWLGEQPWSSGAVGMTGKSYDGSTLWEVAAQGNPYLKTVVPLSGLPSVKGLHFINGTAEGRTPFLWFLYWTFGFNTEGRSEERRLATLCPDVAASLAAATYGTFTGDARGPADALTYWMERDFAPRVLANYQGSVYLEHGLQDWNVHPDMAYPFLNQLQGRTKALLGQWAHDYPDRPEANANATRWDWAESLLRWFDAELKGLDVDTGPAVEVQDNRGRWRTEAAWPPADAQWLALELGAGGTLAEAPGAAGDVLLADAASLPGAAVGFLAGADPGLSEVAFRTEPLAADLRLAGLPQVPLTVTPLGAGGQVYATLWDVAGEERTFVGRGVIDLRFADGGDVAQPLVPGQPLAVALQLMPLDAHVPAGHALELRLATSGYTLRSPLAAPYQLHVGEGRSVLRLPVIERTEADFVGGWPLGTDGAAEAAGAGAAPQRP